MDAIEDARRVLRDAEGRLRDLIQEGLAEQRYADVAEMAWLADAIARLVGTRPERAEPKRVGRPRSRSSAPIRTERQAKAHPQFERDGERLVKIGWSKKKRESYEHRAPRTAVVAFAQHLAGQVRKGELFTMEDLLPVPDVTTGADVPAYQAYVVLAWLRCVGAIEKKGRDGYVLRNGLLSGGALQDLWATLNERSH